MGAIIQSFFNYLPALRSMYNALDHSQITKVNDATYDKIKKSIPSS
jgi:hypothetical protein